MTERDPNLFGDAAFDDGNEQLELPLELFFAEDRGDPERVAASASLEAEVLGRVESRRGFVSSGQRKIIRACRGVALMGALCVLLAAAVADRLGKAPWHPAPSVEAAGPVSGLIASTSRETTVTIERALNIRDRLLDVVEVPPAGDVAIREATLEVKPRLTERAMLRPVVLGRTSGPYLTAEGFGAAGASSVTTIIRFEDGFSMPAMVGESRSELRWPASRAVTAAVVSLDGNASHQTPATLSPVWYAGERRDRSR